MGFVDTLPLFKAKFPECGSYKQEYLVSKCLGVSYNAHNSMDDVQSLRELVKKSSPSFEDHQPYFFTTESVFERILFATQSDRRNLSLEPLISNNV